MAGTRRLFTLDTDAGPARTAVTAGTNHVDRVQPRPRAKGAAAPAKDATCVRPARIRSGALEVAPLPGVSDGRTCGSWWSPGADRVFYGGPLGSPDAVGDRQAASYRAFRRNRQPPRLSICATRQTSWRAPGRADYWAHSIELQPQPHCQSGWRGGADWRENRQRRSLGLFLIVAEPTPAKSANRLEFLGEPRLRPDIYQVIRFPKAFGGSTRTALWSCGTLYASPGGVH